MAIRLFRREVITRHDDTPYLWRLRLLETPWFGIYLHRFLSSDDEYLHDHPWWFVSVLLWGGYYEHSPCATGEYTVQRWYGPGSVLFRRAAAGSNLDAGTPGAAVAAQCMKWIVTAMRWLPSRED